MVKEKLTLSVDKQVIQKAKKLGINISELTEQVLKGYTSAEKPNGSLYDGYKQLFESIIPLIKEFNLDVCVARENEWLLDDNDNPIQLLVESFWLTATGALYAPESNFYIKDIKKLNIGIFLSPKEILSNLIDALIKSKEVQEERMNELLMAKKIIDAMSDRLTTTKKV
jgi:hypothetical protein